SLGRLTRFLRSRRSMNLANAIPPKTNRHNTTNIMVPFVGVGRFSGNLAVVSTGRSSAPANPNAFDLGQNSYDVMEASFHFRLEVQTAMPPAMNQRHCLRP